MGMQRVIEQDNQFHLVVSSSLGIRLSTGESVLEMDALSESLSVMGSNPLPDMGMPKPQAEYLVSGSYYSPGNKPVRGGEVKIDFAGKSKSLNVFGDRSWVMGMPSEAEYITSMPLDYSRAYGGSGYTQNPGGIGFHEERLPNIERPDQLLTSPSASISPAGLGTLDFMVEQRLQYQGTYDDSYLEKYFPGYPPDFDWHYFMSAASDQWSNEYYSGDESFSLHNMHPEKPLISGKLPGYISRCFAQIDNRGDLLEINLNLDTVWFFPEKDLCILTWRGGIDVKDDEAEDVKQLMLAYESEHDDARDIAHYTATFAALLDNKDGMLGELGAVGLIPENEKPAIQILQEKSFTNIEESEFSKNLNAKAETAAESARQKVADAVEEIKSRTPDNELISDNETLKMSELLNSHPELEADVDVEQLNRALEEKLPGITCGDPRSINLKDFSFEKIDSIMDDVDALIEKKIQFANEQIDQHMDDLNKRIDEKVNELDSISDEANEKLKETLHGLDKDKGQPLSPLPRINVESILHEMDQLSPLINESIQNLQTAQAMGDDEAIEQLKSFIVESTNSQNDARQQHLQEIEASFKAMYLETAHHQPMGSPPHKVTLEDRKQIFIEAMKSTSGVRNQDWSGLNLAGMDLQGIDLSGAYLEQVDFSNANLSRANLAGAIMARATLLNTDLSGSHLENANVGAVNATGADFSDCNLSAAKLSKGDFTRAVFKNAKLDATEVLDIIVNEADFSMAVMPDFILINISLDRVKFVGAQLTKLNVMQCQLSHCDFSGADLQGSVWANSGLNQCAFDRSNMTSACFAAEDAGQYKIAETSFVETCLDKANFQGIDMQRANLQSASIIYSNFISANLYGANLSSSIAHNAVFRKAILTNANLEKIDLREGSLAKAHMTGANVRGANLYAVDFLRSTMGSTRFDGSNLDNTIIQDWRPS